MKKYLNNFFVLNLFRISLFCFFFPAQAEEKVVDSYIDKMSALQKKINAVNHQQEELIALPLSEDDKLLQNSLNDQQVRYLCCYDSFVNVEIVA